MTFKLYLGFWSRCELFEDSSTQLFVGIEVVLLFPSLIKWVDLVTQQLLAVLIVLKLACC